MNNSNQTPSFRHNRITKGLAGFMLTALFAIGATAQVAVGTTGIDATGNAASEMAACKSGRTQQDRETCMKEVKNANAAKRAGKIDNSGGQFRANALMRCNALMGEDKLACEARVIGYGNAEGSVAGGGVITGVETVVIPKNAKSVRTQP